MKKHKWFQTLKEILVELSVIPIFCVFLAVATVIVFVLPDGFFDNFPTEAIFVLAVVAILAILYAISSVVTIVQRIRKRSKIEYEDSDI